MQQGGGGYDFGIALSTSSSATSGLEGNFSNIFGDHIAGTAIPVWIPFAILGAVFLLAGMWILSRR